MNVDEPKTHDEALKLLEETRELLENSDKGFAPEAASAEEPEPELESLPESEKKLRRMDSFPKNSKEALEIYGDDQREESDREQDQTQGVDQVQFEPTEEDVQYYNQFESSLNNNSNARANAYLSQLEQENERLRFETQQRNQLLKEASDRQVELEAAQDKQMEENLLIGLRDAFLAGDETKHTRLTGALVDLRASVHTKALARAFQDKYQGEPQSNYSPQGNSRQAYYDQQQYRQPQPPVPETQNIGNYPAKSYPVNNPAPQYRHPADIPPPQLNKPKIPAAAPSQAPQQKESRGSGVKLSNEERQIVSTLPWKGKDGQPLSQSDKEKLYVMSQG